MTKLGELVGLAVLVALGLGQIVRRRLIICAAKRAVRAMLTAKRPATRDAVDYCLHVLEPLRDADSVALARDLTALRRGRPRLTARGDERGD